ncbi:MAG TPA: glycoside hydrolase family 99-like domain-containing protein [Acetobacteraceae bacterium]|nr:glycoside hydrolase family 99-like domain-containing protein [Acetobacteraceae bacterium]
MADAQESPASPAVDEGAGTPAELAALRTSGLFDAPWYCTTYGQAIAGEAFEHFCAEGWRAGFRPNPYFDPLWYLQRNPDVAAAGRNPLLHYLQAGEREGRRPVPYFDPGWYRGACRLPPDGLCLAHFLDLRRTGTVSPIPEFDVGFYLAANPDVAAAGVDPFEHYQFQGFREGRNPSSCFDGAAYARRHPGLGGENPLLHYLDNRSDGATAAPADPAGTDIPTEFRRNTEPGPLFEARRRLPASAPRQAMLLVFYLPQFHAVAENDAWWGEGFTEWANVQRGLPRFAGHYQPRIPRDLGHYDLSDPGVMRRQIAMAREAGIAGFVFYFYWFNRRRLLERPLDSLLADPSLDLPFCLMWANENWTRRWDGSDDEVLISQDYREADEAALIAAFARHFGDRRYIRLGGRPLLMIYRPALIPNTRETIGRWRALFRDIHGEDPLFVMSQSFAATDPRQFGMDGAVEFPPHKLVQGLPLLNDSLALLDPGFNAQVYDYDEVVEASVAEPAPDFPLIKTAVPGWDNDARRQGAGLVLHGATPAKYEAWLRRLIHHAGRHRFEGEAIVCVNAWNEWAEGAYLEPDRHFGAAYLNATAAAAAGLERPAAAGRLLLVGHDAFGAGAQRLLLAIARFLRRQCGVSVEVLLLGGGPLLAAYREAAPTTVAEDATALEAELAQLRARGFGSAIVNSAASTPACAALQRAGFGFTLLVHELPRLLHERGLLEPARQAATAARDVVFAVAAVRDAFRAATGTTGDAASGRGVLLPQGLYHPVSFAAAPRARLRQSLGIRPDALLVLGVGYADLRKGFDLFLQVWRELARRGDAHGCWIGAMDPGLRAHLGPEIAAAEATGRFHLLPAREDAADWFAAADVHLLTSREDPFPSVALEAMSAGTPTIAFAGTGGMPEVLEAHRAGAVVPLGDVAAMAEQALVLAREADSEGFRDRLAAAARQGYAFDRYAIALLHLAQPGLRGISVVVPSWNYGRYLTQRLASIFAQTYPVLEVILLDDASTDDSVAIAEATAAEWGRDIAIVRAERNSGSVFRQWQDGARRARGEWLWIAEADDAAEPRFLERLVEALDRATAPVLGFCDSRAIDAAGTPLWPDHKAYYRESGTTLLTTDAAIAAGEFLRAAMAERNLILNASAVLWRRAALLDAIAACDDLDEYRMAGDWRLYLELLDRAAAEGGEIAYVAESLNLHRRHEASVTHRLEPAAHLAEITRLHRLVAQRLPRESALPGAQARLRQELAERLGVPDAAHGRRPVLRCVV